MPKPLATKEQVAEYLNIHTKTLDRWAQYGQGPAYSKIEGQRRYDWDDVVAYVQARKVATR